MVFGLAFCQTILPVAPSIAKTVLSLPTTKTRVAGPCGVLTLATTGAVMFERIYCFGGVEICAVHFTSSWETLSLLRIFSSGFEPLRSGSWPHVNHSFCALANPADKSSKNASPRANLLFSTRVHPFVEMPDSSEVGAGPLDLWEILLVGR